VSCYWLDFVATGLITNSGIGNDKGRGGEITAGCLVYSVRPKY